MREIIQMGNPILRQVAKPVDLALLTSPELKSLLRDMKEAVYSQDDGVAIAAPQVSESLRVFYISGKILNKLYPEMNEKEDLYFINPEIVKSSKETQIMEEGCLSIRYLYGKVKRSKKVTIRAYDENGKVFERGASGLLAQIIQHENDHLNGVLFTDKAKNIEEILPEDLEN